MAHQLFVFNLHVMYTVVYLANRKFCHQEVNLLPTNSPPREIPGRSNYQNCVRMMLKSTQAVCVKILLLSYYGLHLLCYMEQLCYIYVTIFRTNNYYNAHWKVALICMWAECKTFLLIWELWSIAVNKGR